MDDTLRVGVISSTHGVRGEVKVFSEAYKAFSAGQSDIEDHAERLFLCICDDGEG